VTIVEERPSAGGPVRKAAGKTQAAARKAMLDSQLRTSGVNAPYVLARMGEVPREDFVPENAGGIAYIDRAIALGNARYLAAPLVQGLMLQEARPTLADKALLVDGGSGYMAELLRPLVGSLEVLSPTDAIAVTRKKGDMTLMVIDGAIEQFPDSLIQRLAEDGRVTCGILQNGLTRLAAGRKAAGEVALLPLAEIGIPVLPEFARKKEWSF
jgi:protein-L-isoaspartate(D-aspartate) O-methyltransferase